ncbi:MAG: flagellar hook-basal body complex protein, partial [Bacteroidales bacterium]|nr:flagellar hook-basal body complex protein [Bacteroidales bacterium]
TAYKSQNMVFSDLLYQQTQAASGANADTGRGGINARQIGLGAKTAAINTAITRQGSAQSTNNPWDVMISGESFFIVNSGSQNFFTRDGSFTIDGAGNLVMASTGYRVMGWQVDPETGDVRSDVVSALQVMNRENLVADPEWTTNAYASGILDKNDTSVRSSGGKVMTLTFFDALGYQYTALMSIHGMSEDGNYYVQLDDITNEDGMSLVEYYNLSNIGQIANFGVGGNMDPITRVLSVPSGVTYTPASGTGTGATAATYKVDYSHEESLKGFSANPMMSLAEDLKITRVGTATENPTATPPTTIPDGEPAATGGNNVTVTGSTTLDEDLLTTQYGLVRIKEGTDKGKYYYLDKTATPPAGVLLDGNSAAADWAKVLTKLVGDNTASGGNTGGGTGGGAGGGTTTTTSGAVTVSTVSMDEDGKVTVSFTADFEPEDNYVYNAATGKLSETIVSDGTDAANQKILQNVYKLTDTETMKYTINYIAPDGQASIEINESYNGSLLTFDTQTGKFNYIGSDGQSSATLSFSASATDMTGANVDLGHFTDISVDFSTVSNINNGKVSTIGLDNGDGSSNNLGAGRKHGELIGVEVGQDGKIRASYDNGMTKLLGQIAVAKFANAAGLAKAGNNLYSTTMNSGDFDGIGIDITSDGEGSMESGVLEMSNVDLAGEFTEMITTQRGFQANSRIITTSDSMLEELVNLKR